MQNTKPWVEKYRPQTLNDVVHQDEIVKILTKSIETGSVPHLLLYGPPGTGKTTCVLAFAKQLYGPKLFEKRVMELNASDARGIKTVRTKIKDFASKSVASKPKNYNYPCPPIKLIILDEADSMTPDAQAALRRIMEDYSHNTRFCLLCNYSSRIIDPLSSRCAKFRFKPLDPELVIKRLGWICEQEGVSINRQCLQKLVLVSGGDLRKAITFLQSLQRLRTDIVEDDIDEISGTISNSLISKWMDETLSGDFCSVTTTIIDQGHSVEQFFLQVVDVILQNEKMTDEQKGMTLMELGKIETKIVDCANPCLQILAFGAFIKKLVGDVMDTTE
jgi:replication factor C subunit 2/4